MSSRLTAMDIENQEFSRKFRGYDPGEVDLFLASVAEEVERLNLEHSEMQEQLGQVRRDLGELRSREKTLQKTLVTAQSMADDVKDKASKEGELVVREARVRADNMLREAQDRLLQIEADISRSKLERESFEHRLRSVIDQHLALLNMRRQARSEPDNLRVLTDRVTTEVG